MNSWGESVVNVRIFRTLGILSWANPIDCDRVPVSPYISVYVMELPSGRGESRGSWLLGGLSKAFFKKPSMYCCWYGGS